MDCEFKVSISGYNPLWSNAHNIALASRH